MRQRAVIYARVSSAGAQERRQNTDRQVYSLTKLIKGNGDALIQVFEEHISGVKKNAERTVLNKCLQYAKENAIDIIYFSSIDRLGRAIWEVQENIKYMVDNNINAYFQKEQMSLFIEGKENPFLAIFIAVIATCSQIERDSITFRLSDARNKKKSEAVSKGQTLAQAGFGRPKGTVKNKDVMREQYKDVLTLLRNGYSVRNVATICNRSKTTVQKLKSLFID